MSSKTPDHEEITEDMCRCIIDTLRQTFGRESYFYERVIDWYVRQPPETAGNPVALINFAFHKARNKKQLEACLLEAGIITN